MMDIYPDQGRRLTTSRGPPRLQLVQGLVQLSVQMRLEPNNLVEVQRMREETGTRRREILPLRDVSADGRSPENTEIGSPPTPSDNVPSPMPIGRRDRCWDWRTS